MGASACVSLLPIRASISIQHESLPRADTFRRYLRSYPGAVPNGFVVPTVLDRIDGAGATRVGRKGCSPPDCGRRPVALAAALHHD